MPLFTSYVSRIAVTVLMVLGLGGSAIAQSETRIAGKPIVVEGDALDIGKKRVRLYAIDAPEADQVCQRNDKNYPCGTVSIAALKDLTAGVQRVTCHPIKVSADGLVIARCLDPQKFDLSQQMVYTGWALALPDAPNLFHEIQAKAQKAKRGLWKGHVTPPWRWRAAQ